VDKRVIACVPIVIDLLNIIPSFEHHKAVYGDWAPAVGDYVHMRIMDWMGTKEYEALMAIVEPYSYRDRLTMPKLIMNGCDDQFFLPDSSRFYINDLKGPIYLRYVPNAGHGLDASAIGSVESFYQAIVGGTPIPEYSWTFPDDQTTRVETTAKPSSVKLWQATNPDARDFRLDVVGPIWKSTDLAAEGNGAYVGRVQKPEKGWTAFMVELKFPGPGEAPFTFTTPVRIVPDVLPFKYEHPMPFPKGFLSK
jgi:PhoPQ-activated pathogenicity-related protein